jgi:capsular exopolysaccharide synthesis family protein
MSQLELALKKARAARQGLKPDADTVGSGLAAPNPVFVSAWDFAEQVGRASIAPPTVDAPLSAPAARPTRPAEARRASLEFEPAIREKLVIGEHARHDIREQFGKIAAILYRVRETSGAKVVMIVSAVPGEGKTLTATNLALTLSESYNSKVLLIDADLRRPMVHQVFGISNRIGLKEKLTAADPDAVAAVAVSPHLAVLPAGSSAGDPMGLLVSDRMRAVVTKAAADCDWVILDTPPVELLPDARILAGMADVALLVVHAASTKCELAQRTIETIGRDRVLGVVLNQIADRDQLGGESYYGYYGADMASRA